MIYLLFMPVSAVLGMLGGQKQAWARDLVLPLLVGAGVAIKHPFDLWWVNIIVAIGMAGSCNIIRMGYGAYDPINDDKPSFLGKITKDKDGWNIRTIYGAFAAIVSCLPYLIASGFTQSYFNFVKVLVFTILFSLACFVTVRLRSNVFWTDLVIWGTYGTILFFL